MPTNPDTMFQGSKDEFRPREGDPGGDGRAGQDVNSDSLSQRKKSQDYLLPTTVEIFKLILTFNSRDMCIVLYFACDKNPRERRTNSDFFNPDDKQKIHYKCFPKMNGIII